MVGDPRAARSSSGAEDFSIRDLPAKLVAAEHLDAAAWVNRIDPYAQNLEHLYTHRFQLGSGNSQDAAELLARILDRPNDYFPFRIEVVRCVYPCDQPISKGNILKLEGEYSVGDVQVTNVDRQSFQFFALEGHIAEGGTVEFYILADYQGDEPELSLEVSAFGAGRGVEGSPPSFFTSAIGKLTWSSMAAAITCERTYLGNEQYRRC